MQNGKKRRRRAHMIVLLWIRFILGIIMILCGLIVFAIELFGVFEFHYVLNRMHAAAMGDTLGIALSMTGLIVLCGLNFTSLKMLLVVVFLWFASPVASHMCAISVSFSRNLLNSIIIFMSYSLIMSIIWILLESPDLAITEAAVGAGITSILFFVTLKKIHAIVAINEDKEDKHASRKGDAK